MPKVNANIAELEKLPLAHLEKCYSLLQTKGTGRWKTYVRINLPELYTPAIARTNMDSLWYAICKKINERSRITDIQRNLRGSEMIDGFLTVKDTADLFGVSITTIRRWEKGRIIPLSVRMGHIKLFRKKNLEIAINKRADDRYRDFKRGIA